MSFELADNWLLVSPNSFKLGGHAQLFRYFLNCFGVRSFRGFRQAALGFGSGLHQIDLGSLRDKFFLVFERGCGWDFFLIENHKFLAFVNLNSEAWIVLRIRYRIFDGLGNRFGGFLGLARSKHPLAVGVRPRFGHNFQEEGTRTCTRGLRSALRVTRLYLTLFGVLAYLFCLIWIFGVASLRHAALS